MKRRSVLIVNRAYPPVPGAAGRMLHDLARHLIKQGHKVTILSTSQNGPSFKSKGAVTIIRVKGAQRPNTFEYMAVLYRMYRGMERAQAHDIIITMTDPPLIYALAGRVAYKKRSKHIHWCQDLYPDLFAPLGFFIPRWILNYLYKTSRTALSNVDKIVVIGKCMARKMMHIGFDAKKIVTIENWPDLELGKTYPEKGTNKQLEHSAHLQERRLRSDPRGQKFRILYAGSLGRAHPITPIINAARILQKSQPDVELAFAGKGEGFDRLADLRTRYGLDNIRLLPPQPRHGLKELMQSGDIHLVTMRDNLAGMLLPCKFYSGLAAGRPIIFVGPAECDIAHIVTNFGCGKVVKPDDGKALASAIAYYRNDSDAWFSAHEAAQKAMVDRTPDKAFAAWDNVIRQISDE